MINLTLARIIANGDDDYERELLEEMADYERECEPEASDD
jgi:hypothetical protein